jgi:hypothetical protein
MRRNAINIRSEGLCVRFTFISHPVRSKTACFEAIHVGSLSNAAQTDTIIAHECRYDYSARMPSCGMPSCSAGLGFFSLIFSYSLCLVASTAYSLSNIKAIVRYYLSWVCLLLLLFRGLRFFSLSSLCLVASTAFHCKNLSILTHESNQHRYQSPYHIDHTVADLTQHTFLLRRAVYFNSLAAFHASNYGNFKSHTFFWPVDSYCYHKFF